MATWQRGNVTLHPIRVSERGFAASVGGSRFMLVWNHWFWEALAERFACITGFCSGTKVEPKWNQNGTKMEPQSNIVKSSIVKSSLYRNGSGSQNRRLPYLGASSKRVRSCFVCMFTKNFDPAFFGTNPLFFYVVLCYNKGIERFGCLSCPQGQCVFCF